MVPFSEIENTRKRTGVDLGVQHVLIIVREICGNNIYSISPSCYFWGKKKGRSSKFPDWSHFAME